MQKLQKTPQIRKITPPEHSSVVSLIEGLPDINGFSWPPEKIENELNEAQAWGLWLDQDLAAFIIFRENSEAYEITSLATGAEFQQQGVMKSLLKSLVSAKGQKPWWLEVHEQNQPALRLYEAIGFKEDGRRPRYYPDGKSAILMSFRR